MTDMPERVWASGLETNGSWTADKPPSEWGANASEYTRSDLVPTWQPIDFAPRDGTIMDVWLGDADPADVDFYCTPGTRRSCGWWWNQGKFRPLGGLAAGFTTFVQPTHFMCLPPPPAAGPENGGDG